MVMQENIIMVVPSYLSILKNPECFKNRHPLHGSNLIRKKKPIVKNSFRTSLVILGGYSVIGGYHVSFIAASPGMKIAELSGDDQSSDRSRTFVFYDEGHTLGNALRCVITSYDDVTFCGYTVPHPAESKMHFRIQTTGTRAIDILQRGLEDLEKMCDHTLKVFDESMKDYKATHLTKKEESDFSS